MVLIGLFALALMLVPAAAHAEPFTAFLIAAGMSAFWASVTTFAVVTVLSMAISFVANALLKPQSSGGPRVPGTNTMVIDNKITVRQTTGPRRVIYGEARVAGTYAFMHSTDNNKYLHLVIMFAGHEVEMFTQFWVGDEAFVTYENRAAATPGAFVINSAGFIVDGQYANKVRVEFVRGTADQTALGSLVGESGGLWTTDHRLRGIAYAYVRLEYDRVTFAGGIPNITSVIKGKKVYDPRAGASGWTRNPALCVADYLCDATYGIGIDYSTGIDATALAVAANACDEAVALDGGGAEVRYACNGSFEANVEPQENLGRLLGSMHGKAPFDGERWKIMAGVYYTPTLTFTDDDLRAGPKVQTLTSRRDRFNAVKGTYINPVNFWQESDFPPVENATYATEDGSTIWRDAVLPFTISPSMAQRIAKIDLKKGRQEIVAQMPCKLSAWRCQAGDTIYWTSERYGWTSKAFEVKSARFAVDASNGTLGVDLELSETSPAVYDWSSAEETTVDDAPNTDLPNPFTVLPPSGLILAEEIYTTTDGAGTKSRAIVNWTASPDAFVASYQVEYRLAAGDWVVRPRINDVTAFVHDLAPGNYEFRVAAVNELDKLSTYIAASFTITGTVAVPETPTGLAVVTQGTFGAGSFAILSWTPATQERVKSGGRVEIRYTTGAGGIAWDTATYVIDVPGASMSATVPLSTGTYFIKFKSATGIYSAAAAQVAATADTSRKPYRIGNALPVAGDFIGELFWLTTTSKWYRWTSTVWVPNVAASDIDGQLTDDQIADLDAAKLTGQITETQIDDDSISTPKLRAGAVETTKLAALSVVASKMASTEVSALFASFGNMTAGTMTGPLYQTASSGVRTTISGARTMVHTIDPAYATRSWYRSLGLSEPEIVWHGGADGAVGYSRTLNYNGGMAVNGIALGNPSSPDATPDAQGGVFFGDFAGVNGAGTKNGGIFSGTTYDMYGYGSGNIGPFTAAHDAVIDKDEEVEPGDILVNVAIVAKKNISTTLRRVERATTASDVRRTGVFVQRQPITDFGAPAAISIVVGTQAVLDPAFDYVKATLDRVVMNALGEGGINVCDEGGTAFRVGDLIETSSVPGKGRLQGDDVVRNRTIARVEEDYDLASGEIYQIACGYLNG